MKVRFERGFLVSTDPSEFIWAPCRGPAGFGVSNIDYVYRVFVDGVMVAERVIPPGRTPMDDAVIQGLLPLVNDRGA